MLYFIYFVEKAMQFGCTLKLYSTIQIVWKKIKYALDFYAIFLETYIIFSKKRKIIFCASLCTISNVIYELNVWCQLISFRTVLLYFLWIFIVKLLNCNFSRVRDLSVRTADYGIVHMPLHSFKQPNSDSMSRSIFSIRTYCTRKLYNVIQALLAPIVFVIFATA